VIVIKYPFFWSSKKKSTFQITWWNTDKQKTNKSRSLYKKIFSLSFYFITWWNWWSFLPCPIGCSNWQLPHLHLLIII
jgi:hypothetical protein